MSMPSHIQVQKVAIMLMSFVIGNACSTSSLFLLHRPTKSFGPLCKCTLIWITQSVPPYVMVIITCIFKFRHTSTRVIFILSVGYSTRPVRVAKHFSTTANYCCYVIEIKRTYHASHLTLNLTYLAWFWNSHFDSNSQPTGGAPSA